MAFARATPIARAIASAVKTAAKRALTASKTKTFMPSNAQAVVVKTTPPAQAATVIRQNPSVSLASALLVLGMQTAKRQLMVRSVSPVFPTVKMPVVWNAC